MKVGFGLRLYYGTGGGKERIRLLRRHVVKDMQERNKNGAGVTGCIRTLFNDVTVESSQLDSTHLRCVCVCDSRKDVLLWGLGLCEGEEGGPCHCKLPTTTDGMD